MLLVIALTIVCIGSIVFCCRAAYEMIWDGEFMAIFPIGGAIALTMLIIDLWTGW